MLNYLTQNTIQNALGGMLNYGSFTMSEIQDEKLAQITREFDEIFIKYVAEDFSPLIVSAIVLARLLWLNEALKGQEGIEDYYHFLGHHEESAWEHLEQYINPQLINEMDEEKKSAVILPFRKRSTNDDEHMDS